MIAPVYEKLSADFPDIRFFKIDIDNPVSALCCGVLCVYCPAAGCAWAVWRVLWVVAHGWIVVVG